MYDVPDHPVIRNMERTGYPDGKEPEYPHCPVCREPEACEVYEQLEDGIVGCEACITKQNAEDIQSFLQEGDTPVCPICGNECEYAYTDRDGDPVGCDSCVTLTDAWGKEECFSDKEPPWQE